MKETITFSFAALLFAVAVVLFVIAAFGKWSKATDVGLACTAGGLLVQSL